MFQEILTTISFLKTFIYYSLYYSFKTGQCLVHGFSFILNNLAKILRDWTDLLVIIFESFSIFCQDIFQGLQQIAEFASQIWTEFFFSISTGVWNLNNFFLIISNGISESYNHIHNSVLNLWTLLIATCKLLKYTIIMFGSGVWFTITLIPYSVWSFLIFVLYGIQSIPSIIFVITANGIEFIKECIQGSYLFITDIPLESVIGIAISMCLIYVLSQFYISCFSYFYSKSRRLFLHIQNKFQRLGRREQRINRRPNNHLASLRGRSPIRARISNGLMDVINTVIDDRFCVICQERVKCILVLPCRHVCMCSECNTRLQLYNNTCPICRNDIEDTMKIFV